MSDEFISREAVVRYLKEFSEKGLNSSSPYGMITYSVLNKAERAIFEIPAADVQPVNGWISVKDRLPDEGVNVLTYGARPDYGVIYINRLIDEKQGEWLYDGVTHWMPLPQPPKSPMKNGTE